MEIADEQYDSFYRCHAAGDAIRNASAANITLPGVPTRPITNDDVLFLLYTRFISLKMIFFNFYLI